MTSTEQYTAAANQLRNATEQSAQLWKKGTEALSQGADMLTWIPRIDPEAGVKRYFELVQQAVDVNRDLAAKWAEAVNSMTGVVGKQVHAAGRVAQNRVDTVAGLVVDQASTVEQVAQDQAGKIEQEQKAEARRLQAAERAEAKRAHERAREPYLGLAKAELSDLLADRELPKSGNVDDLVDRLVDADEADAK